MISVHRRFFYAKKEDFIMETKRINGKDIKVVMQELEADFPESEWKLHDYTKKPYLNIQTIEDRLNKIIGVENYDFILDTPKLWNITGKDVVIVKGTILLHCDDGSVIRKDALGGSDITISSGTGTAVGVPNTVDSAARDVFKRCAKMYGVGIVKEANRGANHEQNDILLFHKVKITSPFKLFNQNSAQVESLEGTIIIWEDAWKKLQKLDARFCIGEKINEISFKGRKKPYKGKEQIHFIELASSANLERGEHVG